jgi:cell division septal protein FtsQ
MLAMIKRIVLWVLGILVIVAVAVFLAFRFTPWPSAAVIQLAFSRGGQLRVR